LLQCNQSVDIDSLLQSTRFLNLSDAQVFTDDKPDLDRMNLKATNSWRNGYNAYYARFFLENGVPLFK
jgi:hypothetical protein